MRAGATGFPSLRGTSPSRTRAIVEHLPPESQGPHRFVRIRPPRRREDRASRSSGAYGRAGVPSSRASCRSTRSAVRTSRRSGATRSTIPRTGVPIGSGPFLLSSWERGKQMILVRNPRYWGPHNAYLDRIVLRFCRPCPLLPTPAQVLAGLRQGDVDMVATRDPAVLSEVRSIPGVTGPPIPAHRHEASSTSAWTRAGIRRFATPGPASWCGGHSPTASTDRRSRARSSESSTPATRRVTR